MTGHRDRCKSFTLRGWPVLSALAIAFVATGAARAGDCPAQAADPLWQQAVCEIGENPSGFGATVEEVRAEFQADADEAIIAIYALGKIDRAVFVDWKLGPEPTLDLLAKLFPVNGLPPLTGVEKAAILDRAHTEAMAQARLAASFEWEENEFVASATADLVRERGRELVLLNLTSDEAGYVIVTPETHCRWLGVALGNWGWFMPVLPPAEDCAYRESHDRLAEPNDCGVATQ